MSLLLTDQTLDQVNVPVPDQDVKASLRRSAARVASERGRSRKLSERRRRSVTGRRRRQGTVRGARRCRETWRTAAGVERRAGRGSSRARGKSRKVDVETSKVLLEAAVLQRRCAAVLLSGEYRYPLVTSRSSVCDCTVTAAAVAAEQDCCNVQPRRNEITWNEIVVPIFIKSHANPICPSTAKVYVTAVSSPL